MIRVSVRGSSTKAATALGRLRRREHLRVLGPKYGPVGVAALKQATPVDSGKTAESWYYEIVDKPGYYAIHWLNSNVEEPGHIPVAVLLQYGHASGRSYVRGIDFINPAMRPIFDQIAEDMWKEVTK